MSDKQLCLNLGCGDRPEKGWINQDRQKFNPQVDVWWDLEDDKWPLLVRRGGKCITCKNLRPDDDILSGTFDHLAARDVLEHVCPGRFYHVMDACWDTLKPGGLLHVQVPEFGSLNAVIDPTHWRGFSIESFDYLDPNTRLGKNGWTTPKRWRILKKERKPRSNINLLFDLRKIGHAD